jgi:hypothetical protein
MNDAAVPVGEPGRMHTSETRGFAAGAVLVAAVALVVTSVTTLEAGASVRSQPARLCPGSAHVGGSERAANAVVELFLRTAVVSPVAQARSCRWPTLTVPGLVHPRYETRFPRRIAAWFQLAPRIRNARGLWEYAGFLHVSAPDAAPAAFQFLLELHGRRWLVSSFEAAPGSAEIDVGKLPT